MILVDGVNSTPGRWIDNSSYGGTNGSAAELQEDGYNTVRLMTDFASVNYSTYVSYFSQILDDCYAHNIGVILCFTANTMSNTDWPNIEAELINNIIPAYDAHPGVLGYEPFNEPHSAVAGDFLAYVSGAVTRLRAKTAKTLYIEPGPGSRCYDFQSLTPFPEANIVYCFHNYVGFPASTRRYPPSAGYSWIDLFNEDMKYAYAFKVANPTKDVLCTEWGCRSDAAGIDREQWFWDSKKVFDTYNFGNIIHHYPFITNDPVNPATSQFMWPATTSRFVLGKPKFK